MKKPLAKNYKLDNSLLVTLTWDAQLIETVQGLDEKCVRKLSDIERDENFL